MIPGTHSAWMDGDIPPQLHSAADHAPFRQCIDCGGPLLDTAVPYAIEKVIRHGEVVFEYALCAPCAGLLIRDYSLESLAAIASHLADRPLLVASVAATDACQRCGQAGAAFAACHSVMGLCVGRNVLLGVSAVCGPCAEGVESVLSQRTRDVNGDFIDRTFPGVPAGLDLPLGVLSR